MATLRLHLKKTPARGFTLIEVLFSMVVLSVGLVALGSLTATNLSRTDRAGYDSLAATLASEKIEDLDRWPWWAPSVCVASGTVGSLSSDTSTTSYTCNGITTANVNYYDDVEMSDSAGAVCETVSNPNGATANYLEICHNPNGTTTQSDNSTASASDTNVVAFHRRWTIEMNQPITGVKRITVLVTLSNGYVNPAVSFQMSAVRSASN